MLAKDTQVVVLMGGLGTRLGDITLNKPKPLVEISGKAFFEYELSLLIENGFRNFLFLIGFHAEMIEEYFGDGNRFGTDVSISYSYDGERLLGTGGAVVRALPFLAKEFLLIYGDSYMDVDYNEILYRYSEGKKQGCKALMTVYRNNGRYDSSNVRMEMGEIVSYKKGVDDPSYGYIDYGIEIFQKEVFSGLNEDVPIDLATIQEELVDQKKMSVCEVFRRFYEIGTPNALKEFKRYAQERFFDKHPAVFLDRDGVINEICINDDTGVLDSPLKKSEFKLLPRVNEAIRLLNEYGYLVFVVTNQPAAAKGKANIFELYEINHKMCEMLEAMGCRIDDVEMCPHHPDGNNKTKYKYLIQVCNCRKPGTGLIDRIKGKYAIDNENSWMVGDSYTDIQSGRKAGLNTIFLGDYKCDVCAKLKYNKPEAIASDLYEAVGIILSNKGKEQS